MNVTVKLPDDLCRAARHRAVDQSKSLSKWLADLIRSELSKPERITEKPPTWMDAFSGNTDDEFLDRELPLPDRKAMTARTINLQD